jgi:sporulation integral membrane protein YlbJ
LKRIFLTTLKVGTIILLIACLISPAVASEGAKLGISLCIQSVLPSLFPFFVLCSLFFDLELYKGAEKIFSPIFSKLYNLSGTCSCALLFGLISGYPLGAKTAADLYSRNLCTKRQANRLLFFANNSGVGFLIGAVGGGLFGSAKIGWLLYLSHIAAALICGLFSRLIPSENYCRKTALIQKDNEYVNLPLILVNAVKDSFFTLLGVCAFVIFFSVVITILISIGFFPMTANFLCKIFPFLSVPCIEGILAGLVEMTTGSKLLSMLDNLPTAFVSASFILGFGGLSVHCQALSFILQKGLSPKIYLTGKSLHACLCGAVSFLLIPFLPQSVPAFSKASYFQFAFDLPLILYIILFAMSAFYPFLCLHLSQKRLSFLK